MRTEVFLHRWLDGEYGDHAGYDYDVVTDHDLHREPEMLAGYKTLFINGHSEYWSADAYHGVDRFLRGGGTVIALSGNTMDKFIGISQRAVGLPHFFQGRAGGEIAIAGMHRQHPGKDRIQ